MKRKSWYYRGKDGKPRKANPTPFPHRNYINWGFRKNFDGLRFSNKPLMAPLARYNAKWVTKTVYNGHGYFFKGYYRYGSRMTVLSGIIGYVRKKRNIK